MHQGAVPVTLDMCFKALLRTVPIYLAEIVAAAGPVAETFEVLEDTHSNFMCLQIHKCISQAKFGLESGWYMDEIVHSREALIIQCLEKHVSRAFNGQIAQDYCCGR